MCLEIGFPMNKYISGCHILCLGWLRTKCSREVHRGLYMGGSRGGHGVRTPPPPEKSQKYRVSVS